VLLHEGGRIAHMMSRLAAAGVKATIVSIAFVPGGAM
jgi:hypothetical protein